MKMTIKLSELKPGQSGIIKEFGTSDIHIKLLEMGFIPGEKIVMEQIAPLGDPVSVTVAGYQLSLRLEEAEKILIEINN
ncbi:MAG: ferrous iron transport protein A [Chitinophagaceae bacterium]|nr:ferrous iron transport protein A [Chitinophagaceae bacterium]